MKKGRGEGEKGKEGELKERRSGGKRWRKMMDVKKWRKSERKMITFDS